MEKILFKMAKNSPILRLTFTFKALFCGFIEYFKHSSAYLQSVAKLKQKKPLPALFYACTQSICRPLNKSEKAIKLIRKNKNGYILYSRVR